MSSTPKGKGIDSCRVCGAPLSEGRMELCPECSGKLSKARLRLRQERIAQGLCQYCGKQPFVPGMAGCAECLKRISDRAEAKRIRQAAGSAGMRSDRSRLSDTERMVRAAGKKPGQGIELYGMQLGPDTLHALSICAQNTFGGRTQNKCDRCTRRHKECLFLKALNDDRYGEHQLLQFGTELAELAFGLLIEYINGTLKLQ